MASISDDDLCSDCQHCIYHPGEDSDCTEDFPGETDDDGYVIDCPEYDPVEEEKMNTRDVKRIASAANAILWLWRDVVQEGERNEPDPVRRAWYRLEARQAYQNSINAMKTCGLIEDYNMLNVQVKIKGVWRADRHTVVFKARNVGSTS